MAQAQDTQAPPADTTSSDAAVTTRGPFIERNETARGLASGLGLLSTAVGTAALEYNPAGMSQARSYHLQANAGYVPSVGNYTIGAAVTDSITTSLAAGLSARGIIGTSDKAGSYSGFDARLGLSIPIASELSLGFSGRYISLTSKTSPSTELVKGFTGDAALQLNLGDVVKIAAVGQNLIDKKSPLVPVLVGGSVNVQILNSIIVGGDILFDLTTDSKAKPMIGAALEYFTGKAPVRAGYLHDNVRNSHYITGGLGYMTDKFGVEAALRQEVSGPSDLNTWILTSLTFFVQ